MPGGRRTSGRIPHLWKTFAASLASATRRKRAAGGPRDPIGADAASIEPAGAVALEHMLWLLDDALEHARTCEGMVRAEPIEMRTLLADTAALRRSDRLFVEPAPWPIYVLAKRGTLARVLAILIERALQTSSRAILRMDRGTTAMLVHIDDDGPGVPRNERARLFDAPDTHKPAAHALATARGLVRALNGEITVSSSPEGGARFTVRLPTLSESELDFAAAS